MARQDNKQNYKREERQVDVEDSIREDWGGWGMLLVWKRIYKSQTSYVLEFWREKEERKTTEELARNHQRCVEMPGASWDEVKELRRVEKMHCLMCSKYTSCRWRLRCHVSKTNFPPGPFMIVMCSWDMAYDVVVPTSSLNMKDWRNEGQWRFALIWIGQNPHATWRWYQTSTTQLGHLWTSNKFNQISHSRLLSPNATFKRYYDFKFAI